MFVYLLQQTNKQTKNPDKVDRRRSEPPKPLNENQSTNRMSTPITVGSTNKPVNSTQSNRNADSNSNWNSVGKTTIQVQSLKPNTVVVKHDSDVNGANDDINKLSFDEKKVIVHSALDETAETLKPELNSAEETNVQNGHNFKETVNVEKSIDAKNTTNVSMSTPYKESNTLSESEENKPKPEVVKSSVSFSKPSSKVVMNADKQMLDLDSFTERKNMLSELKTFDKQLKSVPNKERLTEVKVSVDKNSSSENVSTESENKPSKSALFGDIKLAKKPSEFKQQQNVDAAPESKKTVKTESEVADEQSRMFDNILSDVYNASSDSESSENSSPREGGNSPRTNDNTYNETNDTGADDKGAQNIDSSSVASGGVYLAGAGEITVSPPRGITTVIEESEGDEVAPDDDRFVTEFSFPGVASLSRPKTGRWFQYTYFKRKRFALDINVMYPHNTYHQHHPYQQQ